MASWNNEQARRRLDDWLSKPLFLLSLAFLLVLGGLAHRFPQPHATDLEKQVMAAFLLAIWPVFWFEALLRFLTRDRSRPPLDDEESDGEEACPHSSRRRGWFRPLAYPLLIAVFPPARLACWSYTGARRLWLPGWGWQEASDALCKRLERLFSVPMIVLALLVLPILTLQYFWDEVVRRELLLNAALDVGSTLIWMAFVIEFTLMIAAAESKARYCRDHWLELLIIVLPVLDFMPLLRALRLLRVAKPVLTYYARYYRLYGVVTKIWQNMVLWNLLGRLRRRYWPLDPQKELKQLQASLREQEQEHDRILARIEELKQRITETEARVAARRKAAASAASPAEEGAVR